YAHHPEEIRAFIMSVKEYYAGRRITGIFQPHLYSRTRDLAKGFASVLDELDEAIILPIYPARENPIPGVSSEMIFERMRSVRKRMLNLEDIPGKIDLKGVDILATIGAGNIDTRIPVIEKALIETFG
ncbi:MAG: UDP-N-acetylmuramate--L-alanine ligase, partial [Bacteroidales bacterium]|nr:UDP-N-acetylmuramate--L-alanine ligase [Bacteroidales bacterium]